MAIEDIKTFNVPNFEQWNFETGDTDEAITKQNANNAALTTLGNNINTQALQIRTVLSETVSQLETATDDAVTEAQGYADNASSSATSAARSVTTAQQAASNAQAISETGLPAQDGNEGKVLGTDGVATRWRDIPASFISYEELTMSGQWFPDPDATWVYVEAIGGGGPGGSIAFNNNRVASGGGGGGFVSGILKIDKPDYEIIIGSGGASTPAGQTSSMQNGGSTVFADIVALGGHAGSRTSGSGDLALLGGNSGSGASALIIKNGSSQVGYANSQSGYSGGAGGSVQILNGFSFFFNAGSSIKGGGGGAAGATSGTSVTRGIRGMANGYSGLAGAGGLANHENPDGNFPGGGGGASTSSDYRSGKGGDGVIRIWQFR